MTLDPASAAMENLRKALSTSLSGSQITVCLGAMGTSGELPIIQRLEISGNLVTEFRGICDSTMDHTRRSLAAGDSALAVYEAGSRPDSYEIEYLKVGDHDFVSRQLESIVGMADVPVFQCEEEFVAGLLFYVIVVTPAGGHPILFYRVYSPSKELSKSKTFLALFTNGRYDKVRDPGLLFDHKIDCMVHDGYLFIFNKSNFQRIFQYFEMVKKSAREALDIIRQRIPIFNFDEFQAVCEGHLQKLAKLKNISQRPYLATVTMQDLKNVINEFQLPIKTVNESGEEKLVYDPSDKWAILKLLDEDYLNSIMTGNKYEATGKRSIAAPALRKASR